MGRNITTRWRAGTLEVLAALLLAALVACATTAAPRAYADEGLAAGSVGSGLSAQALDSTYAVLMQDNTATSEGNKYIIYPANANGAKIGDTWTGTTSSASKNNIKGSVTKLFIAADIKTLPYGVKYKYVGSNGNEYLGSYYGSVLSFKNIMPKLQKVEFLLSGGKSAVAEIGISGARSAFTGLELMDEVINFDKTQISEVPNYAFDGCKSLVSITLPNTVTSIGNHAFRDCIKINVLNLGNSLMSVGDFAFRDCTELGLNGRAVIFPRTFMQLGKSVFSGCTNLHTVRG